MIYFVQPAEGGHVKIGTTVRLSHRLKALCREFGTEFRVLAVMDGDIKTERALHRRFASLHVDRELFEPGDDLLAFIIQHGREWQGEDEAELNLMAPIASLKGSPEFREWFVSLAKHHRLSPPLLIEHALVAFAKQSEFPEPAPER